uniref:Yip1 domain-containing protein n=1 Tax=Salix viminalis TaxID=40686 RepID=A0A6N2M6R8_SALVM
MDWGNVTAEDLIGALKEVDWTSPPRPANEFFSKFAIPRSYSKWSSRLKCNLYYYRTNYFILILLVLGVACILRPLAILATALSALSIAFLNDRPVIRGRPSAKKSAYIFGRPRLLFVLLFSAASFVLWYTSGSLLYVSWALITGLLVLALHASFKTPNLKARLNTFREEFREAVVTEEKAKTILNYEVPEENMQNFPPYINGASGRGYQTLGSPPEGFEQQPPPNNWKGVFSISSYMQYFNVDTDIVVNRLMSSFYPIGGDFFSKIDANPDLYGLVWVSTTLIFVLASLGNLATYLIEKRTDNKSSWSFDVGYVNAAVFSVYGYAIVVPLAFYFLFRYLGSNPKLIQFWCMWGYSLFIFVPSSFLLVIPVEAFRWIFILVAGVDSGMFVAMSLKTLVEGNDLAIMVVAAFFLQLALAIFFKKTGAVSSFLSQTNKADYLVSLESEIQVEHEEDQIETFGA